MNKIINNLNSKYTTELGNLDYGDFFELNNTAYQFLYHSDGGLENFDGEEEVYLLDVEVTILGYTKEE